MDAATKQRIEDMIASKKVFLFMKGTPAQPMCGFSAGVVSTLNSISTDYGSFNVLSDPAIREGIKEYGNWPTIPQLYINGELVGGHDIVVQMSQSGDLESKIKS
ncbi:Grx4 family monothiol glutaredoxin [Leptospira sp. GIMC2001]|uniref:Grx4 family monothiol glutaredoxin n=1 Tax=Leptospira sp. GIMC2001 TaxID=1513297 RepID=UPI00234A47D4|nr:Grx4 family monothiol glutaredoxin [Leptospira sp. GIMC2001]WCL51140.1 Grx4 family monothiol glutaredoxin [Leptospira sp. GIMC2001]